jgi:hypothetical protein
VVDLTYFSDLSSYAYSQVAGAWSELLNVGWLEAGHEYRTGAVSEAFITALGRLCAFRKVNHMRGIHPCRLGECAGRDVWPPIRVIIDGVETMFGDAEVRVPYLDGTWFDAPDLIYHYVTVHGYQPPDAFIDAVMMHEQGGNQC